MEACWPEEENDDVPCDSVEHQIEVHQIEESPAISLHAIAGTHTPQTMWVTGTINHRTVSVLLDFGSTHNFLKEELARGMGLISDPYGSLEDQVPSRERISSAGYDVILDAQWLSTLGPILWDFSKLQMQFSLEEQHVCLKGLSKSANKIVSETKFQKEARRHNNGLIVHLHALNGRDPTNENQQED
ncbi:hypothetical protein Pint_12123 [Pistacia integerrima]|uniref:Uncharacterized protein n=1 Tax=Pistacia integerrima TaxID=434235 RepID=A0ACC0XME0_9ROSI|nr:hypothetical protein Pint_12123 [Pistacia integerrima]